MQKAKFFIPIPQWFSPNGRISRLQYFVFFIASVALSIVPSIAIHRILFKIIRPQNTDMSFAVIVSLSYGVLIIFLSYIIFCLSGKRLHDLGINAGVASFVLITPCLNTVSGLLGLTVGLPPMADSIIHTISLIGNVAIICMGIILLSWPGQERKNRYGPEPLQPPLPIEVF